MPVSDEPKKRKKRSDGIILSEELDEMLRSAGIPAPKSVRLSDDFEMLVRSMTFTTPMDPDIATMKLEGVLSRVKSEVRAVEAERTERGAMTYLEHPETSFVTQDSTAKTEGLDAE